MAQRYGSRWLTSRACALVSLLAGLYCSPVLAASWAVEGRVVGVSDGDTVTILDRANTQHKIRLSGIDAPEKGQAFGEHSKQHLADLVHERFVHAHCHKRDRYGREVCKVMRGSTDVNIEQVRAGMAWSYREYTKEQTSEDRVRYEFAE